MKTFDQILYNHHKIIEIEQLSVSLRFKGTEKYTEERYDLFIR